MISKLESGLCPEAIRLQELGNELIARADYYAATLGRWAQGPMYGFSDGAEHPTTVLTAPYPWLPEEDGERLLEASGLKHPIFSIASAAIYSSQPPRIVTVSLGGTMNRSLFKDQGKCWVGITTQRLDGNQSTVSFGQDGMNADAGIGYDPIDILGLIDRIRQVTQ